jgi:hypothetical protein
MPADGALPGCGETEEGRKSGWQLDFSFKI